MNSRARNSVLAGTKCGIVMCLLACLPAFSLLGCFAGRGVQPGELKPVVKYASSPDSADELRDYRIQPGDSLAVRIYGKSQLAALYETQAMAVDASGLIVLPMIGEMRAMGRTIAELRQDLTEDFSKELASPIIQVTIVRRTGSRIYVLGEVKSPGMQTLESRTTSMEAILAAGGFTTDARSDRVVLIRPRVRGPDAVPGEPTADRTSLDFERLLAEANLQANVVLHPGDILYVPSSRMSRSARFHQHLYSILSPYLAIFRLGGDIFLINEALNKGGE